MDLIYPRNSGFCPGLLLLNRFLVFLLEEQVSTSVSPALATHEMQQELWAGQAFSHTALSSWYHKLCVWSFKGVFKWATGSLNKVCDRAQSTWNRCWEVYCGFLWKLELCLIPPSTQFNCTSLKCYFSWSDEKYLNFISLPFFFFWVVFPTVFNEYFHLNERFWVKKSELHAQRNLIQQEKRIIPGFPSCTCASCNTLFCL